MAAVTNSRLAPLPEIDPSSTFATVKAFYHRTETPAFDWMRDSARVRFASENVSGIAAVVTFFSRYLLSAFNTFFIENDKGVARVDAISDTAIRVIYFAGEYAGNNEWIQAIDFMGNLNAQPRKFKEQPMTYLKFKA